MRIISKPRGQGKTTEAIKLAHKVDGYIVCLNHQEAVRVFNYAKELNLKIRFPITFEELSRGMHNAYPNQALIVDNADQYFNWLVKGRHQVVGLTTNVDNPNAPQDYLEFINEQDKKERGYLTKGEWWEE